MTQLIKIFCGFFARQKIIIVNADGLPGALLFLANKHIQKALLTQVVHHGVVLAAVEQDETVVLPALTHCLQRLKHLCRILAGNHRTGHLALVAHLADSTDYLEIKRILVGFLWRGREQHTDHTQPLIRLLGRGAGFIAQLAHGVADPLAGFGADGWVIVAHTGYAGGGNTRKSGNILDCNSHAFSP